MHCGTFLEEISVSRVRLPLSSRFYEMMGLRTVMPSRHEYNRWNLPLNQLPMKFLNYREWGNPLSWDVNY
jgi:hypothetical protein